MCANKQVTRRASNSLICAPGLRTRASSIAGGAGEARSPRCRGCSKTRRSLHMYAHIHTHIRAIFIRKVSSTIAIEEKPLQGPCKFFPGRERSCKVLPGPGDARSKVRSKVRSKIRARSPRVLFTMTYRTYIRTYMHAMVRAGARRIACPCAINPTRRYTHACRVSVRASR